MAVNRPWSWPKLRDELRHAIAGTQALAFFPAGVLAAYWIGGEPALIGTAVLLPIAFLALGGFSHRTPPSFPLQGTPKTLLQRDVFRELVDKIHVGTRDRTTGSALFQVQIDEYQSLIDRHGQAAADSVIKRISERIIPQMRDQDNIARLGDCTFALCLGPSRHRDLEVCIQMAGRLQTAIEEPVSVDGVSVFVTTSIVFAFAVVLREFRGQIRCLQPQLRFWRRRNADHQLFARFPKKCSA